MNIKQDISDFIDTISKKTKVPQFISNDFDNFNPDKSRVFYSGPYWDDEEIKNAVTTFLTGKWLPSGENVNRFERQFSKKINVKSSVMVNSGSSANLLMLEAMRKVFGWKDGDEIIVSPVGFPTTIAPIVQVNMKPVFIDIEFETLNFDLELIEEKITNKTKGIFLSPVLGNPPDMDRLLEICEKHDVKLILDGCDSLGTTWRGKPIQEYAEASSCSFYPAHHITTGEGGMISSNNEEIVATARSFSWWGRDCYCVGSANKLPNGTCKARFSNWLKPEYTEIVDHRYVFANMGYNLKPLDLQGSIGLAQIKKLDEIHTKRMNSKNTLSDIIEKHCDVYVPRELKHAESSWFGTPIVCDNKEQKDKLVSYFESNRIETRNYFAGNILFHPGYKHLDNYENYPNSNKVFDKVFFIGAAPHYTQDVFDYVDGVLKQYD
tara:strand:+ start:464 stop:1768 length:1305 start_codon:yes stop_codon:yes gene_type:complete